MEPSVVIITILLIVTVIVAAILAGRLIANEDPKKKIIGWLLVVVVGILAIAIPGFVLFKVYSIFDLYNRFADTLINEADVPKYLAHGLLLLAFLPYAVLIKWFFSLKSNQRKISRAGIVVYIAVFNLVMYGLTREHLFEHRIDSDNGVDTLVARKWYAITPEGCAFYNTPGYDVKYGIKLAPLTPEAAIECESLKRKATGIDFEDSTAYFDFATGMAIKWYNIDNRGVIQFYSHSGFDPVTGLPLLPVDVNIIARFLGQKDSLATAQARADELERKDTIRRQQEEAAHSYRKELLTSVSAFQNSQDYAIVPTSRTFNEFGIDLGGVKSSIDDYLQNSGLRGQTSPFTEKFTQDGYIERLLNNDTSVFDRLGISATAGQIIIVDFSQSEPISSGNFQILELTVMIVGMKFDGSRSIQKSISAKGVGKDRQGATAQALLDLKARLSELS